MPSLKSPWTSEFLDHTGGSSMEQPAAPSLFSTSSLSDASPNSSPYWASICCSSFSSSDMAAQLCSLYSSASLWWTDRIILQPRAGPMCARQIWQTLLICFLLSLAEFLLAPQLLRLLDLLSVLLFHLLPVCLHTPVTFADESNELSH